MICEDCGEDKEDVKLDYCPYAEEIYGIDEVCTLCQECYDERAADI